MQTIQHAERAFVSSLVEQTRVLVQNDKISKAEKVDQIQSAIAKHASRAKELRYASKVTRDKARASTLDRLAEIRERAIQYLRSTAQWIVSQRDNGTSLRQMPRLFAVETWGDKVPSNSQANQKEEYPFMEFSS